MAASTTNYHLDAQVDLGNSLYPTCLDLKEEQPVNTYNSLHLAASSLDFDRVQDLLTQGKDFGAQNEQGQTPLHILFASKISTTDQESLIACAISMLKSIQSKTIEERKVLYSKVDADGITMADLFIENCWTQMTLISSTACRGNLKGLGSFLMYRCRLILWHCCCIKKYPEPTFHKEAPFVLCEVLKWFPSSCIKSIHKVWDKAIDKSARHEVKLDFNCLLTNVAQVNSSKCLSASPSKKGPVETEMLYRLLQSGRNNLNDIPNFFSTRHFNGCAEDEFTEQILNHPLIKAFVHQKWKKLQKFAWISLFFYLILALAMSFYVINIQIGKCRIQIDKEALRNNFSQHEEQVQNFGRSAVIGEALIRGINRSEGQAIKIRTVREFFHLQMTPPPFLNHTSDSCQIGFKSSIARYLILTMIVIVMIFELIEMCSDGPAYFCDIRNYLQWLLIVLTTMACVPDMQQASVEHLYDLYQAAAFELLVIWILLMVQLSKFKILATYIDMLIKVFANFVRALLALGCIFVGFVLCNMVLFNNKPSSKTIPRSFLNLLAGFAGDLSYSELFHYTPKQYIPDVLFYPWAAHIFYISFIVLCSIVLFNLLVGLSVNDVSSILRKAEVNSLLRMIKEIYLTEKLCSNLANSCELFNLQFLSDFLKGLTALDIPNPKLESSSTKKPNLRKLKDKFGNIFSGNKPKKLNNTKLLVPSKQSYVTRHYRSTSTRIMEHRNVTTDIQETCITRNLENI